MVMLARPGVFKPKTRVRVDCTTARGVLRGDGEVVKVIDAQPAGACGFEYIYLIRMGHDLKVVPGGSLSTRGVK